MWARGSFSRKDNSHYIRIRVVPKERGKQPPTLGKYDGKVKSI